MGGRERKREVAMAGTSLEAQFLAQGVLLGTGPDQGCPVMSRAK